MAIPSIRSAFHAPDWRCNLYYWTSRKYRSHLWRWFSGNISVYFGTTAATVQSTTANKIVATVPEGVNAGLQPITVRKGTATSNAIYYNVLSGDQNQIVFHVSAETQLGENIYIVGNIPELGNWNPDNCTESMLNPNYPEWFLPVSVPSGTTIEFKFIKKMP